MGAAGGGSLGTAGDDWVPKILVVEDSVTRRAEMKVWLRREGYEAQVANDGQEAFELLQQLGPEQRPDVILSDVQMPRLDGPGLVAAIKAEPSLASIPVILYTARDLDGGGEGHDKVRDILRGAVTFESVKDALASKVKALRTLKKLEAARKALSRPPG